MAASRSRSSASRLLAAPGMPASARALRRAPEANRALHSVSSGAISGQHLPGAADPLACVACVGLGPAAGGEHGGGGAQRGEMSGGIPLVRRVEHGGLVEAGAGLGEQIESGGRRGGAAQDGVDVGRRTGQ